MPGNLRVMILKNKEITRKSQNPWLPSKNENKLAVKIVQKELLDLLTMFQMFCPGLQAFPAVADQHCYWN